MVDGKRHCGVIGALGQVHTSFSNREYLFPSFLSVYLVHLISNFTIAPGVSDLAHFAAPVEKVAEAAIHVKQIFT